MKIQYCSDLHLEFSENSDFLMRNKLLPIGDILILAGDITYLAEEFYKNPFFDYVSDSFQVVYWIPGNHEFYDGFDLAYFEKPVMEKIRQNVYLVNNTSIRHDDTELFLTTLWTRIDPKYRSYTVRGVNDFYKIQSNGKIISDEEFELHHELSVSFLREALAKSEAKNRIVATHHVPSQICNALEFVGSWINSAFVVEMEDFIGRHYIDYWIYGHHHRNLEERKISNTSLVTNQLGYVHLYENKSFRLDAAFEV